MFNDYQHLEQFNLNTREHQNKAQRARFNLKQKNKRNPKKG